MLQVFWQNFLTFDFLILLLAIVNGAVFRQTMLTVRQIRSKLYPSGYLPGGWENLETIRRHYLDAYDAAGEVQLVKLRSRMNLGYALYENITGIFPLMGLLGTVISLIPMVRSLGSINTNLFFSALTSTFWGIVFAIIGKALNGYLEAQIGEAEKNIQTFIDRRSALTRPMDVEPHEPA